MKKLFLLTGVLLLGACSYRPAFMASVDPVPVSNVELAPPPAPITLTSPAAVPATIPESGEPVNGASLQGTDGQ
jgi:uncharacterized lipoprotein YajG